MKTLMLINRVLLTLLGVSTGAVKLFGMEQEMALFAKAGFSTGATVAFGIVQIAAALLLLHNRSARVGAIGLLISFVIATGVLFINGMIPFGVVSLSFIAMAGFVIAKPELQLSRSAKSRAA